MATIDQKIEDWPLTKKMDLARLALVNRKLAPGVLIDALDEVRTWCVAEILEVRENDVYFKFDGWQEKYNKSYPKNSQSIQPFRFHSRVYTGQKHVAYKREEFNPEKLAQNLEKAKQTIASDFSNLTTAYEIVQYLRGHLLIYVHFLFSYDYSDIEDQTKNVVIFLKTVMELIVLWLKWFSKNFSSYIEYNKIYMLFLVDRNIALASCLPEISYLLDLYFCRSHQSLIFFERYDFNYTEEIGSSPFLNKAAIEPNAYELKRKKKINNDEMKQIVASNRELKYGLLITFFHTFCVNGGLDAVKAIMTYEKAKRPDKMVDIEPSSFSALDAASRLVFVFYVARAIISESTAKSVVQAVEESALKIIENMDPKELKDVNKHHFTIAVKAFEDVLRLVHNKDKAAEIIDNCELLFSLKLIQCPYMERRLRGINDINARIESLSQNEVSNSQSAPVSSSQWINTEKLLLWIKSNNMLSLIYNESAHPEMLKKGITVLIFLAKKNMVTLETIDFLWNYHLNKHEEVVRVVYNSIESIIEYLPLPLIDHLDTKIKQISYEKYDEKFLEFMKDFTIQAFYVHETSKQSEEMTDTPMLSQIEAENSNPNPKVEFTVPTTGLYCMPIFWEIIQESVPFSSEITEQALQAFKKFIQEKHFAKYKIQYLNLCIQNVQNGKSVYQNLLLSKLLLSQLKSPRITIVNSQHSGNSSQTISQHEVSVETKQLSVQEETIQKLNKQFKLVELIISSLVKYCRVSESKLQVKGPPNQIKKDPIIEGKFSHSLNLNMRFQFLEYIVQISNDLKLDAISIEALWTEFVVKCKAFENTKYFLKWISSKSETKSMQSILTKDANIYLFNMISKHCAELSTKFGTTYYNCFVKYFRIVNKDMDSIEEKYEYCQAKNISKLYGLEELWGIAAHNKHEKARSSFSNLLVNLYLYPSDELIPQRISIWREFTSKLMQKVDNAHTENDGNAIANLISMQLLFYKKLDGESYLLITLIQSTVDKDVQKIKITITIRPENKLHIVEVPSYYTIGHLRRRIADLMHVNYIDCRIVVSGNNLDFEGDDSYAKDEIKLENTVIISRIEPLLKSENHPRKEMAQNQDNINKIFHLLSKENELYAQLCWDLLNALPRNEKIENEIRNINIPNSETASWNLLLDSGSVHKLLYSLQIMKDVIKEPEFIQGQDGDPEVVKFNNELEEQRSLWIRQFLDKQGGNHLFYCLLNISMHSISQPLTRKCFILLMKSINAVFKKESSIGALAPLYESNRDNIIERILTAFEVFVRPSAKAARKLTRMSHHDSQAEDDGFFEDIEKDPVEIKVREEEAKAIDDGFALIKSTYKSDYNYFERMKKFDRFMSLMKNGLIFSDNNQLRKFFSTQIINICSDFQRFSSFECSPYQVVIMLYLQDFINDPLLLEQVHLDPYSTLKQIIDRTPKILLAKLPINMQEVIVKITTMLVNHKSREHQATNIDHVLNGFLGLLNSLLKKFPECKLTVGTGIPNLLNEVLHKCLFDYPYSGSRSLQMTESITPPKCKSQDSRKAAFNLLCTLARDTPQNLDSIISYLAPLHKTSTLRLSNPSDWSIAPPATEKSSTGFVGIRNLGCICYAISLIQQLYMIPSFRRAILGAKLLPPTNVANIASPQTPATSTAPPSTSFPLPTECSELVQYDTTVKDEMLYEVQALFATLEESVKQSYNPITFCRAFKDWEGNPINEFEQMDVDEFFNMFTDKLETALKGTTMTGTIKKHFEGMFENQLICKDCPHKREVHEPFSAVNLQIKNKKSLQECLESFVEGEIMEGNNAYYCDRCDKKVSAIKRVCIKTLPKHLIFVLKRFSYNYDVMQKIKLNDFCRFPMSLNMEPYTVESLAQKIIEKDSDPLSKEGSMTDTMQSPKIKQNYNYKLVGVVIHRGTADSGHYYSLILDRERTDAPEKERWYEFNDENVEKFDPEGIAEDAFGGEDRWEEGGRKKKAEKSSNAYMLVYEQIPESGVEEMKPESPSTQDLIDRKIHEAVMLDNKRYWQAKFFLSDDYYFFVNMLSQTWNSFDVILPASILTQQEHAKMRALPITPYRPLKMCEDEKPAKPLDEKIAAEMQLRVAKFITTVVLTVFARARSRDNFFSLADILKTYLRRYVDVSKWLLSEFTNSENFAEFVLSISPSDVRILMVGLLHNAAAIVYFKERDIINKNSAQSVLANFEKFVFSKLEICRQYKSYSSAFLLLFHKLNFNGSENLIFLHSIEAVRRILNFVIEIEETPTTYSSKLTYAENTNADLTVRRDQYSVIPIPQFFNNLGAFDSSFLIVCVSNLIRNYNPMKSGVTSPLAISPVGIPYDKCISPIFSNVKNIKRILGECKLKAALNYFSCALIHLGWESESFKTIIKEVVLECLEEAEWDDVKRSFRPIYMMTKQHLDSLTLNLIEGVIKDFSEIMRKYQHAYYFMLFSVEHIIKMCSRSPVMLECFKRTALSWEWIIGYLEKNYHTPRPIIGWQVKHFKKEEDNARVLGQNYYSVTTQELNSQKNTTMEHIEQLQKIKDGNELIRAADFNSEDDLLNERFAIKESIEFRTDVTKNDWSIGTVEKVVGDFIKISYKYGNKECTIWRENSTDLVAKSRTHPQCYVQDGTSSCKQNSSSEESNN